jgi:hypothetical protein
MLKPLWERYHDCVGERVSVISFHVSFYIELFGQLVQSYFELDLVPEYHGWHFIVVLGSTHVPVSGILDLLLKLLNVL